MRTTGRHTGTTCTRLNRDSKITQILVYIRDNTLATRHEIQTNVLGKVGTAYELRGYYSCMFADLRDIGVIQSSRYGYMITEKGREILKKLDV